MNLLVLAFCFLYTFQGYEEPKQPLWAQNDYIVYHRQIAQAQLTIANRQFEQALRHYEQVFDQYRFVFRRDYQVATQLALQVGQVNKAFTYLQKGIASGWDWKSIRRNKFLKPLASYPQWKSLKKEYGVLKQQHRKTINLQIRKEVKSMFGADQRKALGALLTFSAKGQDRYAQKRFAPHSEKQLAKLNQILITLGYPGEQLIGNGTWAAVILSHHNSISQTYALQDTLYSSMRAKLWNAVRIGQMSAYEFAKVDEWYVTVKSGHKEKNAGYLSEMLTSSEREEANRIRETMGLSSVETINDLLEIQEQTGMNFYLPLHSRVKVNITQ